MDQNKSTEPKKPAANPVDGDKKIILAIGFFIVGVLVVALTIYTIVMMIQRQNKPGIQNGVGADGFRVYIDDRADLGMATFVSKDSVISSLGDKAKSVGDAQISKVFNQNDILRQQLTFDFKRSDGIQASLYVDKIVYPSEPAVKKDNVYAGTLEAGKINNYPAYYRRAITLGKFREYSMMLVNGATVYRFVISQPGNSIVIKEPDAIDVLKKLALDAKMTNK